ncbi:heavy-metal-associated domain-containing protein [Leifsonia sp. AG29]|uniref:heavy-metal-associated domain-containing protein n=1 Tax=Leifsonia sp. AG29 TaxID=2598860 RepID=UPI00131E23AB|nr:heavy-metal-associated domain-containing protein [Leifsonia sp. AG29]
MQTRYDVLGMTCDHCARAVSGELSALEGVSAVEVDVEQGTALVTSDGPLDEALVADAVAEAGYSLGRPGRLPLL